MFKPKLIWTRTKELFGRQAKQGAYSIFGFQKQFGHFTPADAFKLFDTMVKPIACCGAEIWGYRYSDEIEKVQTTFCRQYIGFKGNIMDSFVLDECGRYCMAVSYMTQCIKYWTKLLQMPTNRYPHQCYIRCFVRWTKLVVLHGPHMYVLFYLNMDLVICGSQIQ